MDVVICGLSEWDAQNSRSNIRFDLDAIRNNFDSINLTHNSIGIRTSVIKSECVSN